MIEFGRAETREERTEVARFFYSVYVEEMGRFRDVADHDKHELRDPEDAYSWLFVARDDGRIVGAMRDTWGGDGFSERQIRQYCLEPFLAEMPAEQLVVGERTMLAAAYRGGSVYTDLTVSSAPVFASYDVSLIFGACEPHLVLRYADIGARPYAPRNFFSAESGYLIPNVAVEGSGSAIADALTAGESYDWRDGSRYKALPIGVRRRLESFGSVWAATLQGGSAYRTHLAEALAKLPGEQAGLFDGLSEEGIGRCTERSLVIDCAAGDHVIKREGTARNAFVVLEGELQAFDGDRLIRTLGRGDVFGESGLLLRSARSADVLVTTDGTRVLSLSDKSLGHVLSDTGEDASRLSANLVAILAARLRDANALTG